MRVLYPGTFDPVTNGHLDVITRLVTLADTIIVAVAINTEKHPLFTDEERTAMLTDVCHPWPQVEVITFRGAIVEAVRQTGAAMIVRGIRGGSESEWELHMAQMNRAMTGIETLLLPTSSQWACLSATLVRELVRVGGDVAPFVPPLVAERIAARLRG